MNTTKVYLTAQLDNKNDGRHTQHTTTQHDDQYSIPRIALTCYIIRTSIKPVL